MKLNEVLSQTNKPISGYLGQNPMLKFLGAGIQAMAFEHNKHPNTVIKVIHLGHDDIVVQFIKLCLAHQKNPFFPRIYKAKMYNVSAKGQRVDVLKFEKMIKDLYPDEDIEYLKPTVEADKIMMVVMEKLHPLLGDISFEAVASSLQRLGILDSDKDVMNMYPKDTVMLIRRALMNMNTDRFRAELIQKTKNNKFKEALQLLDPIFNQGAADIHSGNLMVRYTSTGPQIVLSDPVTTLA